MNRIINVKLQYVYVYYNIQRQKRIHDQEKAVKQIEHDREESVRDISKHLDDDEISSKVNY